MSATCVGLAAQLDVAADARKLDASKSDASKSDAGQVGHAEISAPLFKADC
ncbi:hypothetical protein SH139x_003992 [Planctomycetaceae bacterium SH139]